ncbi:hypothetical protein RclHR1_00670008 [Rhizophagus clarus]|uniref:F-box domain-containing protein n=1 Tax=Rhizophagus clarus TaxID=94130 RepID=A0A2Z6RT99_9GLOM|nr:hypothetical protein RclHR1_00670008 [Rhizophagus clarus]GET00356.1 hypothetical protein GLOIN_2v1876445 [Rhizophagus clarus]
MFQLHTDCLNEIFEYINDKGSLYSCLLVNRLWCKISVRFFWKDMENYTTSNFNTLISCLPNESKEILSNNEIIISTPTLNPMFNYASFCKVLSIDRVYNKIEELLMNQENSSFQNLKDDIIILSQEIFKLFVKQIPSLKKLVTFWSSHTSHNYIIVYPETKDFLKNLSELHCNSDICPILFYHLSQFCYNISLLNITFNKFISNGLRDLIIVQKNLKYFNLMQYNYPENLLPSLITKLPNTLIKLNLYGKNNISLSFIADLKNLQILQLSFQSSENFEDFESLQYVILPQLQILKIQRAFPKYDLLIKFLENNGKNLKVFYLGDIKGYSDNSLNLAIIKFCPNLKKLSTGIKNGELETLKLIFNSCQLLESIKIWCGSTFLSEKDAFETVVKHSHQNFSKLILYYLYYVQPRLFPDELEEIFISWANRVPLKPLSLVIITDYFCKNTLNKYDDNMYIIKKYIRSGVIRNFKVTGFDDDDESCY